MLSLIHYVHIHVPFIETTNTNHRKLSRQVKCIEYKKPHRVHLFHAFKFMILILLQHFSLTENLNKKSLVNGFSHEIWIQNQNHYLKRVNRLPVMSPNLPFFFFSKVKCKRNEFRYLTFLHFLQTFLRFLQFPFFPLTNHRRRKKKSESK